MLQQQEARIPKEELDATIAKWNVDSE